MNLPNKLTIVRIILTPFYLFFMLFSRWNIWHYLAALIIFAVASLTDMLDGKIARKNNQVTDFGKLCDPLADKMLTTAALLAFMQAGVCNIWIVMIVLTREFLITSFRLVAASQGVVIAAGFLGKLKTVSQMVFSIVIMCLLFLTECVSLDFNAVAIASNIMLGITAVLTVISGIKYLKDGLKVIDFSK